MPQIITEIHYVKKFVPKGVKRLGRFYHCEMLGAACNYIVEADERLKSKEPVERKESTVSSF